MSITIYSIAWNEVDILPQVHAYYLQRFPNAKFVLYDNNSTDGTPEMAKSLGYKVISFDTDGKMDDKTHMDIKNSCWKTCETKWAIVSDLDELLDVTEHDLSLNGFNVSQSNGYEMFGNTSIIDECKTGVESAGYSKVALFKPSHFKEMNFGAGAHTCDPAPMPGESIAWRTSKVNLYHFKWSNPKRALERARILAKKQSEHNQQMNWSFHYGLADEVHRDYYWNGVLNSKIVR